MNQAKMNESFRSQLPPLAEQKRIVAKVDELMALCDRLEAQQQERETRHAALARASLARFADAPTPANLQFLFHPSYTITPADLRKSILTLAVQGKLVPQDPNDEPAEELLDCTDKDLKAKKARLRKLPVEDSEKPFQLPHSWTGHDSATSRDLKPWLRPIGFLQASSDSVLTTLGFMRRAAFEGSSIRRATYIFWIQIVQNSLSSDGDLFIHDRPNKQLGPL